LLRSLPIALCFFLGACHSPLPVTNNPGPTALSAPNPQPSTHVTYADVPAQQTITTDSVGHHYWFFVNPQGSGALMVSRQPSGGDLFFHQIDHLKVLSTRNLITKTTGNLSIHALFNGNATQLLLQETDYRGNTSLPVNPDVKFRQIDLSNLQSSEVQTLTGSDLQSNFSSSHVLVNAQGNGYLSMMMNPVKLSSTVEQGATQTKERAVDDNPSRMQLAYLPIQNYQLQFPIQYMDVPTSQPNKIRVWLNSERVMLILEPVGLNWQLRRIKNKSEQTFPIQTANSPEITVDDQGNGHVFTRGNPYAKEPYRYYPLQNFQLGEPVDISVPVREYANTSISLLGDQAILVETLSYKPTDMIWPIYVYRLDKGREVATQTIQYPLAAKRLPLGGALVDLLPNGQGLIHWGSMQQGGSDPRYHLHALNNYQAMEPLMWPEDVYTAPTPFPTPQPNVTSQLPSPVPSTAAPGEVSSFPQLMLSTSQLCVGEPLTIGLVSPYFNHSLIPISLQKAPAASAATNEVGGNKQPSTPYEDTVLLGDLSVSPTGEGAFTFTLQSQYTTRKGEPLVIESGQRYLLYWEPRPGAFSYIGYFTACQPGP
jgi:hypothetical protein